MHKHLTMMTGLLLACASAWATDFYVAPDGKDSNPGTQEKPFATVTAARDAAKRGDRIILRGGTYRLSEPLVLGPRNSGVTWMAFQDEKPILSGGVPVTGWTAATNGRFKATVNLDNFRQLWVNGRRAQRARGAVPAGLTLWGKHEASVKKGAIPSGLSGMTNGTPGYFPGTLENIQPAGYTVPDGKLASWRNPGDMEFGYYNSWSHMIAKMEKIIADGGGARIEMAQPGFYLCHRKGGVQAKAPAYLENALELLDEPGEWYFDRPAHTLYYLPRPGEDMAKAEVIAPKLEKLVEIKGTLDQPVRDLRFEGLTFAHATWLQPSTAMGHPDVQANVIAALDGGYFRPEQVGSWVSINQDGCKSPANVVVDAAQGVRFERCTFTALGGAGLDLQNGAQSNIVVGCRFADISGNGIQVGDVTRDDHHPSDPHRIVKDNRIVNNSISHVGQEYTDAVGVFYGYTEGTVIAHNEIFAIPYSGISGGWGWGMTDAGGGAYVDVFKWSTPTTAKNNRIEFNHIHDVNLLRDDGGCIYTLGRQPGTIIRGNHVHHSVQGHGIYLDEGSGDIEVSSNLIYQVRNALNFNNGAQNRRASCSVHDNYLTGQAFTNSSVVEEPIATDPAQFTLIAKVLIFQHPVGADARRWIVCKGANEWADGNISLFVSGANVGGYVNIGGGPTNVHEIVGTGGPLPLGKWTSIALTYDGDRLAVYCDGREVGAKKVGKSRSSCAAPVTIGHRGDRFQGTAFDCGDIAEVLLFNRVLTPGEFDKDGDGLVKRWNLDQASKQSSFQKIIAEAGLEMAYRNLPAPAASAPKRIIADYDMGDDCDDIGGHAVLLHLMDLGECEVIACGYTGNWTTAPYGPANIAALNTWYGRTNIPVGRQLSGPAFDPSKGHNNYGTFLATYSGYTNGVGDDCYKLYRRALVNSPDHSVTMVFQGQMSNLYNLFHSPADEISRLTGAQLLDVKVAELVLLAGIYPSGSEHDLITDPVGAQVINSLSTNTCVTFSGYNNGAGVKTKSNQMTGNPVRDGYDHFFAVYGGKTRESWGALTSIYAVRGLSFGGTTYFTRSPPGSNVVDDRGNNTFKVGAGKNQSYLSEALDGSAFAAIVQGLMDAAD